MLGSLKSSVTSSSYIIFTCKTTCSRFAHTPQPLSTLYLCDSRPEVLLNVRLIEDECAFIILYEYFTHIYTYIKNETQRLSSLRYINSSSLTFSTNVNKLNLYLNSFSFKFLLLRTVFHNHGFDRTNELVGTLTHTCMYT